MKLSYEDKVQIYELRKQGQSFKQLSKRFGVDVSGLKYMVKLIDRYGIEFVKKGKNRYYSPDLKQEMINKVLHEGWTKDRVSLEYGLPSRTILLNWLAQYRKNGYTIVEKTRGRVPESGECHPKKVKRTPIEGGKRERRKTEIVQELMTEFSLALLLKAIKLARSIYYYHLKQLDKPDAENLIQGQFEGSKTMEQCYTDMTEFAIPASTQKLYLSPVLDGFNSEIIAYNLSTSPNLEQVQTMLEQAFTEKHYENTILHSDQGWQYQHDSYHRFLESKGVQASMSRKGNSPDNGMMESFFGILKSEMFYGYEKSFQSLKQLEQAIVDYIDYYNNKRIKVKLKGLSPVQYRTKSFG
ncbi:TPA: IS3 family transposase [Streptococcus pneumoniae]